MSGRTEAQRAEREAEFRRLVGRLDKEGKRIILALKAAEDRKRPLKDG